MKEVAVVEEDRKHDFSITLSEIVEINNREDAFETFDGGEDTSNVFGIYELGKRPIFLKAPSQVAMARWMLAIDGLKSTPALTSIVRVSTKPHTSFFFFSLLFFPHFDTVCLCMCVYLHGRLRVLC
jgi:hypothetical protein